MINVHSYLIWEGNMKYFNESSIVFGVIGGFFANLLGGWDAILKLFLFCIIADYVTGVLAALVNQKLSSEVGLKGIVKKVMMIIVVSFSSSMQSLLPLPLREIVLMFFIANEGISLLENCSNVGLPLPKELKNALIQLRNGSDKDKKGCGKDDRCNKNL